MQGGCGHQWLVEAETGTRGHGDMERFSEHHQLVLTAPMQGRPIKK
ncbi:MAG TPA: hypothetical protein V6D26_00865 [Stenomitos sp.]